MRETACAPWTAAASILPRWGGGSCATSRWNSTPTATPATRAGARSRGRFDQGGCAMSVVENVMVREVIAVARDTSLAAVARLFALHRIAGAPVVDDNGRPMGIVSRTDLV